MIKVRPAAKLTIDRWFRSVFASQGDTLEAFDGADALLDAEQLGEVGGFVRDDRSYASGPCGGTIGLAGVALVADGGARRDVRSDVEQDGEMRRIRLLAAGQVESDDGARRI